MLEQKYIEIKRFLMKFFSIEPLIRLKIASILYFFYRHEGIKGFFPFLEYLNKSKP